METLYTSRDNAIDLLLKSDGVAEDISSITKAEVRFLGATYSSATDADAFDWTTDGTNGILTLQLGKISALPAGRDRNTEVIIYDATNVNGIVWATFDLKVIDITI